ncbi:type-2 ice-structuring protein-like [Micropterus salmoides]|uniref:type-2 ice-structuring protein-like n=1 Tax=Micropterus salmoides TaxID=27706 RepID=UPI0018EBE73C|nr:type-2 ice-structuring protein-like [Micropterus salmoides]
MPEDPSSTVYKSWCFSGSAAPDRTTEATDAEKEEEKIVLQQVIIIFNICIISTMKTLTLSALLCAMMALTRAAALPDAEDEPGTEGTAVQDTEAGNWTNSFTPGESRVVKRLTLCPFGWTAFKGRCFLYVPRVMSWAAAERNCRSMGGHLASIHNIQEYHQIQTMIMRATHYQREAWIGGFDAQQEGYWLWIDGTHFGFTHWCPGEPSAYYLQHCLQMNYSDQKCWDDRQCDVHLPSVCVRNVS